MYDPKPLNLDDVVLPQELLDLTDRITEQVHEIWAEGRIKDLLSATGYTDVSQLNEAAGYKEEDYYYMVLEEKVIDFIYDNAIPKTSDSGQPATEVETQATSEDAGTEAGSTEAQ